MLKIEGHPYAGIFAGPGAWFAIFNPEKHMHEEPYHFSEQDRLEAFILKNANKPGCIVNCSTQSLGQLWQNNHVKAMVNLKLNQGQAFDYICNRDHTIRWLYPSKLNAPSFLSLYNGTGWKARIYTSLFKFSYSLKLSHLVRSGQLHVRLKADAALSVLMNKMSDTNLAAFTGTKGQNRKAVISFSNKGQALSFLKVPLTTAAARLIHKEHAILKKLATSTPVHFTYPSILNTGEAGLHISNVKPAKTYPVSRLTDTHLLALQESYQLYNEVSNSIGQSAFWQGIKNDISSLSDLELSNNLDSIQVDTTTFLLKKLYRSIDTHQKIILNLAHGDFTPWNSFFDGQKIYTYDWELSEMLPLLYDAFHFIFQSGILIHRADFTAIKSQIDQLAERPIVQSVVEQYQLDFQLCYKLYLLKTIAYYLPRYIKQEQLHEQAHWLLEVWGDALGELA